MELIRIVWQGNTVGTPGKWHATATLSEGESVYGADGDTPLDAVTELARELAKIVGYERSHAMAYAGEALKNNIRRTWQIN